MKVLVFTESLPPRFGSDRRIFEIMKRLSDKHEVHFVVFPAYRELSGELPKRKHNSSAHSGLPNSEIKYEGINGHFLAVTPKIVSMWQHSMVISFLLTALLLLLQSIRTMRKISPDVIVLDCPSPYTGLLGFLTGKLFSRPVAVDFSDLIAQYTIAIMKLKKNSLKAKLLVQIQNYIVKYSDKVVAPTHFLKKYAISLHVSPRKVSVISNGVDTRIFAPNGSSDSEFRNDMRLNGQKLCVYCGRLDGWAGMNIVSKLSDMAKTKWADLSFLLVGDGEEPVVEKGNLILLGEIPYERVPGILTAADAILVPFPNNEVSHAASPLKLFEGMAMQKPVIASKVSGIEEVITDGQNGFLADSDDIVEWMQKLDTVFTSYGLGARVGKNARETVLRGFDWGFLARRFDRILNDCYVKWE